MLAVLLSFAATLLGSGRWTRLAHRLPSSPATGPPPQAPLVTLYRDTNGWCPFCERVWIQLQAKGIPYEEVLINLQDKPQWYKDMVPTTLVPAVRLHHAQSGAEPEVVWESDAVMRRLEEVYPESPMLPVEGTDARVAAEAMLADSSRLSAAGFQYASSLRNQSLTDADRQQRRAAFEERLDHLETSIGRGGGPFLSGTQLGLVDAMYAPFLERWAVQLPLTSEFHLRPAHGSSDPARWPKIEAWFGAMESVPAYRSRVSGDAYSWSAAVATFQRMFSANGTLTDAQRDVARRADTAALLELKRVREEGMAGGVASSAALAAAQKLIGNWEAVVADATNAHPKSQTQLQRIDPEHRESVELTLADCAARLLVMAGHWQGAEDEEDEEEARALCESHVRGDAIEHKTRAEAARYVASRLCAPRDMGADAASAMRAVLMQMASESEALAWQQSGGLF